MDTEFDCLEDLTTPKPTPYRLGDFIVEWDPLANRTHVISRFRKSRLDRWLSNSETEDPEDE